MGGGGKNNAEEVRGGGAGGSCFSLGGGGGGGEWHPTLLPFSPVQLIFFILIQHHISKLSKYFLTTFQSVQDSSPHKAVLRISTALIFFS